MVGTRQLETVVRVVAVDLAICAVVGTGKLLGMSRAGHVQRRLLLGAAMLWRTVSRALVTLIGTKHFRVPFHQHRPVLRKQFTEVVVLNVRCSVAPDRQFWLDAWWKAGSKSRSQVELVQGSVFWTP